MQDPHIIKTTCAICGGTGRSTIADAGGIWLGRDVVHVDPEVCRDELRRQKAELDRQREKKQ